MKDEYGRINNRAQAIREMNKLHMAYIFKNITEHPENYPKNTTEWLEWLNADSGETIDNF